MSGPDSIKPKTETSDDFKINFISPVGETGWDRLRMMYTKNIYQQKSSELEMVTMTTMGGFIGGALVGAMSVTRDTRTDFLRRNKDTMFENPHRAQRLYKDRMLIEWIKHGVKWGLKMGLFTGSYSLISTSIYTYRNNGGFLEHLIAGTVCGSLYKVNLGLRGFVAGGVIGAGFGSLAGCLMSFVLWSSGSSIEEMRFWQHDYMNQQYEKKKKKLEARLLEEKQKQLEDDIRKQF